MKDSFAHLWLIVSLAVCIMYYPLPSCLQMMWQVTFFCVAFKNISWDLICLNMGFWVYPIWGLQILSDVCINICHKIWVVLAMTYTLFLLFFPCFCSNTSIINILVCLMVSPQVSETVTFIFLQFKRIPSTDIYSSVQIIFLAQISQSHLLISSNTVLSNYRIPTWFW